MTLVQDVASGLNNVSDKTELENYIQRMYSETRQFVAAHPFGTGTEDLA